MSDHRTRRSVIGATGTLAAVALAGCTGDSSGEGSDDESMADESMDDESMGNETMDDESMGNETMGNESMDDESMDN